MSTLNKQKLSQITSKFTVLSNELKPLQFSGSFVPVPYLPGHDYVLLPGAADGFLRMTYSDVVPDCLQNYAYSFVLRQPEVTFYTGLNQNNKFIAGHHESQPAF